MSSIICHKGESTSGQYHTILVENNILNAYHFETKLTFCNDDKISTTRVSLLNIQGILGNI